MLPHVVYMIRGLPELVPLTLRRRFSFKTCRAISTMAMRMCAQMPIAARIEKQVLAVYSGIGHNVGPTTKIPMQGIL